MNDKEYQDNKPKIKVYKARWVLPISKNPIENGAIAIKGDTIISVGEADNITQQFNEPAIDLGNSIIFPGFVNVHTHLEHDTLPETPTRYLQYLDFVKVGLQEKSADEKIKITKKNVASCLEFGTIALADFSTYGDSGYPLMESPIFARIFHEVESFQKHNAHDEFTKHKKIIEKFPQKKSVTQHLAPSSLWRNSPDLLREISVNEQHIATHIGVTAAEEQFLLTGEGRLKQYLLAQNDFDYTWESPGLTPLRFFLENKIYSRHNILIHFLHFSEKELQEIHNYHTKINVCICPRSVEIFDLKKPQIDLLLKNNINICLGTESTAVVQDLDIKKELIKCVDDHGVNPNIALKFATLNGAYAIGFHKEVGSLDNDKTAKCLVAKCDADEIKKPFEAILSTSNNFQWLDEIS